MINALILSAVGIIAIVVIIRVRAVDDFVLDESEFKARLAEMFKDQPEILEHLDEPIVEPEGYVGTPSRLSVILDGSDNGRHNKRLTASRLTDWKVIRTCSRKSLYHLSFEEVAAMYGTSEEDLIRFLNARCPNVLYRREYYRQLEQAAKDIRPYTRDSRVSGSA